MIRPHLTFGETIRAVRKKKGKPLRVFAAAMEIDSALLSKIERGERLPTKKQLPKFARYYNIPVKELTAQFIADKISQEYGLHDITLNAVGIVQERMSPYHKSRK